MVNKKRNAGIVKAICTSPEKGTVKRETKEGRLIEDWGIEGDAHAGRWHRQVSLLSYESFCSFQEKSGIQLAPGAFGENLLISGLDLASLPVGSTLAVGEALLEITQIGKTCHTDCEIRHLTGDCIMPREGIFARVRRGGTIRAGDGVESAGPAVPFLRLIM